MLTELKNPWLALPQRPPFVLAEDVEALERLNACAKPEHFVDTNLLPEPFFGSIDAPVVLLNLNPGLSKEDADVHSRPSFQAAVLRTLRGEASDYPFYYLDPAEDGPGHRWWRNRLKSLISVTSNSSVASRVLCVEFFPYHSRKFGRSKFALPSQQFGFALVRAAMQRRALIILMRSKRLWLTAIPGLAKYGDFFELQNCQRVWVSPRNCPDGFGKIVERVKA